MWALRGPTSAMALSRTTIMLPPATPRVRTSREVRYSLCPPTSAFLIITRPSLMADMSTEVPPTSIKMPSVICSYISAPATPAARPDSMVRMGRLRTSLMLITPPSHRMIISGLWMAASWTLRSVMSAVSIILGMRAAFTAAVRVRASRP